MEAEQFEDIAAAAGHPAGGQCYSLVRDSTLQTVDGSGRAMTMGGGQGRTAISSETATPVISAGPPQEAVSKYAFLPTRPRHIRAASFALLPVSTTANAIDTTCPPARSMRVPTHPDQGV